jgi:hypothetical protein
MSTNRRAFLRGGAYVALGLTIPFAGKSSLVEEFLNFKKLPAYGLQLWTVKEDLAANPKEVLKKVASFGYKQIESFEGKNGMFWGLKNTEFKKYLDDLGTKIISTH